MIITETGILVSTDPNMRDPAPLTFKIEGGQVGDNSVRATGLTGDTTYYAQSYFVKDGIYVRQKGVTEFKTAAQEEVLKIKNAYAGSNTIGITKTGSPDAITLDYSTDEGATWNTWNSASGNFSVTLAEGEEVWLKGNNYRISNGTSNCHNFTSSQVFECEGNLFSLIRKDTFILPDACFASLFKDSKVITPPELPAIDLGGSCYAQMFYGCSYLTTAPVLPATVIKQSSYWRMFYNCTALTQAPAIPATSVGSSGCYQMFYGCTALLSAPTLPATSVGESGYNGMFYGCTALTTAPATLPAIVMNTAGYRQMFYGCTSLTQAPDLPATTIADNCYYQMFYNCTALIQAPATLPGTALAQGCYREMFYGCTALTTPPASIQASAAAESCCYRMFRGCTSLVSAPTLLPTTLAYSCYQEMFYGCTGLTQAPDTLPATTLADSCYSMMFQGCTSIRTAPTLPATTLNPGSYYQMFFGCSSLNRIVCYATSWNTNNATYWVAGVAPTGDFYNLGGASIPIDNRSGVPIGWTLHTSLSDPLTFRNTASGSNTISLSKIDSPTADITLSYSTDGGSTWTTWTSANGNLSVTLPVNGTLKFKGNNTSFCKGNGYYNFGSTASCTVSGDINTLIDENGGNITYTLARGEGLFKGLFKNMTLLDNAGIVLPSTKIAGNCYSSMFEGCTSLTNVPDLPATNLGTYSSGGCYTSMFMGCTSLRTVPTNLLPSTSVSIGCYSRMFENCTALTNLPSLPATDLTYTYLSMGANGCYESMFAHCTSITSIPSGYLPATTLSHQCYGSMFAGCTLLSSLPSNLLPATTLADWCYDKMFGTYIITPGNPGVSAYCTSLTSVPSNLLPATTLASYCYNDMFTDSAITQSPDLPATTLADHAYMNMFNWCRSLRKITCYASDISATDCLLGWTYNVNSSGSFYNLGGATYPRGTSGIPTGWTEYTSL